MSSLSDINGVLGEVQGMFGRSVTYRKIVFGVYTAATLALATTATDYTVTALREPSSTRTIGGGGGAKDAISFTYTIRISDLDTAAGGAFQPDSNDRIVDATVVYRITRWERSADGLAWLITASASK